MTTLVKGSKAYYKVVPVSSIKVPKQEVSVSPDFPPQVFKKLKQSLDSVALIYDEEHNSVSINLSECVNSSNNFDKERLVQLLRLAIMLGHEKSNMVELSFWGFFDVSLALNLTFGGVKFLDYIKSLREFIDKHISAFCECKSWQDMNIRITPLNSKKFKDRFLYKNQGTNKLFNPWYFSEDDKTYYIHDRLHDDLISFGYSKEQVKQVIHRSEMSGNLDLMPRVILKKYFKVPNSGFEVHNAFYNNIGE